MVTNCKNCGLPIFHGAAGYAGAQCKCGFSAKPNYDRNALAELLKERDALRKQLDKACELLIRCYMERNSSDLDTAVNRWLKVNK